MNNEQIVEVSKKSITIFQAVVTLIPILFVILGVGFSYASGVDQNTNDVVEVKADIKDLQEVKVDINMLNVSTATLKNEVEHIKESQARAENQINETNTLLRTLIVESKEQKTAITRPEKEKSRIFYMLPPPHQDRNNRRLRQYQQEQYKQRYNQW